MTQLKTLRDLKVCDGCDAEGYTNLGADNDCCNKRDLKQEAIKWIKELEKQELHHALVPETTETWQVIDFIKYFFNITEEDLK